MLRIRLLTVAYCAVAFTLNPADAEGIVVAGITGIIVVPFALNRVARNVARNIAADYARTIALRRRLAERTCPPGCHCQTRRPAGSN